VVRALGWDVGTRLDIRVRAGLVLITADPHAVFRVTHPGQVRIPAGVRDWCGMLLLSRLGIDPADLTRVAPDRPPAPTFAEYVPIVSAAVTAGTRRVYGSYWNRITEHWGHRRLDEPTPTEIKALGEQIRTTVVVRRNASGGRGAAEHLIAALGGVELRAGTTAMSPVDSARAESLLAYLVVHWDAPVARQHVAGVLWPDSTESQARTNLRHVLHRLRRALVEPNRGDLLPACYDDWADGERQRLRGRYVDGLGRLARLLARRGEYAEAGPSRGAAAASRSLAEPCSRTGHRPRRRRLRRPGLATPRDSRHRPGLPHRPDGPDHVAHETAVIDAAAAAWIQRIVAHRPPAPRLRRIRPRPPGGVLSFRVAELIAGTKRSGRTGP
jgi:hypothetical protein